MDDLSNRVVAFHRRGLKIKHVALTFRVSVARVVEVLEAAGEVFDDPRIALPDELLQRYVKSGRSFKGLSLEYHHTAKELRRRWLDLRSLEKKPSTDTTKVKVTKARKKIPKKNTTGYVVPRIAAPKAGLPKESTNPLIQACIKKGINKLPPSYSR